MRKLTVFLFCILLMGLTSGCGSNYDWSIDPEEGLEAVDLDSVGELYHIRITAGDTVLSGVLYDTETAGAFAKMLPLTVDLWHPAPGFARAFDLPERIPRYEKSGYEYELGSLAYWYEGPSIALVYQASREETVVPVVPIGKITSDVSCFQEYEAEITIEIEDNDENEGTPVARELASRGYQSFVVNYRLRPYTQEEGALDLVRAVRFVRKNAEVYGIEENDIAVMGFSAGGILAGEMLLNFDGLVNGTALDAAYIPDALDEVSADAAADGMIYSFYGRLSVGSTDVEMLRSGNLPPTFYCYGTRDPFYEQFLANADAVDAAGVRVERLELSGRPHGFGYREDWFDAYDSFLTNVFSDQ